MPSPEVCTLPRGFSGPLEQGFLVHSHMAIHSIEDGGNTISFVFRPNASCLAADGRHVLPGVLEVLNDTATTKTIYAQTVNGTSAASVDLSTTFAAPVRADRLLEIAAVCDKHGRRLAFTRCEFFELEDRVDAPFPEPGAPLRRAGLVATGRHVKAMNWRDADDIKLRPTMELAPFPHADEAFVFAPRNPLPQGEAVGALSERERRFRERAHRALQAGGAAATMGAGTDARLHEVRFAEDGGGGGAFVRFVVAANEVVGVPCVGP